MAAEVFELTNQASSGYFTLDPRLLPGDVPPYVLEEAEHALADIPDARAQEVRAWIKAEQMFLVKTNDQRIELGQASLGLFNVAAELYDQNDDVQNVVRIALSKASLLAYECWAAGKPFKGESRIRYLRAVMSTGALLLESGVQFALGARRDVLQHEVIAMLALQAVHGQTTPELIGLQATGRQQFATSATSARNKKERNLNNWRLSFMTEQDGQWSMTHKIVMSRRNRHGKRPRDASIRILDGIELCNPNMTNPADFTLKALIEHHRYRNHADEDFMNESNWAQFNLLSVLTSSTS